MRRERVMLTLGVLSPLLAAAIALATRPWVPVLDMAMTELRLRDVGGRHTPLVGLPGRIGRTLDEQGSHPGPWSFYLVAPWYRLAGARAWGMQLASCAINAALAGLAIWLGGRRFGWAGSAVLAAVLAIALRGYGFNVLTHPWNPYFPLLFWLVALLAAWLVLEGDHWLAVLVVGLSSVAAQTHVPYLVNAIAIDALVLGVLAWRVYRRHAAWRPLAVAVGLGALLWLPPFVEQVVQSPGSPPGNLGKLIRHFTGEPTEPAIGLAAAGRLVLQHLDWVRLAHGLVTGKQAFVDRADVAGDPNAGVSLVGLGVLMAWAAAAAWAWRRGHRPLVHLHAVIATTLLVGLASSARIFGKVWFYLTMWMSATALLILVALAWTVVLVLRDRQARLALTQRAVTGLALALVAVTTSASIVTAIGQRPPEERQGANVRLALPELLTVLDRDTRYVVFWQESVIPGSQGWAVFNELERRGYSVGTHPTWHVPATEHRVFPAGTYAAEVHVVSGGWIDTWAADHPGAELVVTADQRDDAERARFDELRRQAVGRLAEIGRSDLIEVVDRNLFGASFQPGLPDDVVADLSEMIEIGEPLAIFVAPPGATA